MDWRKQVLEFLKAHKTLHRFPVLFHGNIMELWEGTVRIEKKGMGWKVSVPSYRPADWPPQYYDNMDDVIEFCRALWNCMWAKPVKEAV